MLLFFHVNEVNLHDSHRELTNTECHLDAMSSAVPQERHILYNETTKSIRRSSSAAPLVHLCSRVRDSRGMKVNGVKYVVRSA